MRKILLFIKNLFSIIKLDVLHFLVNFAEPAVEVVEVIKKYIGNPALDIIAALSGSKIPGEILAALRSALPKITEYLNHIKPIENCLELTDDASVIKCLGEQLKQIDPQLLPDLYKFIAKQIILHKTPTANTISDSKANLLVELAYQKVQHMELVPADEAVAQTAFSADDLPMEVPAINAGDVAENNHKPSNNNQDV